jgi:hypothetical protein
MPEDRNPHKYVYTQIYDYDCNVLFTVLETWYKVINNSNCDSATASTTTTTTTTTNNNNNNNISF